jgi:hypothetical protein
LAGGDLECGDQWRLPSREYPAAVAIRDLPAGDPRVGWARGVIPGVFALPAGIGDVTTGLLALPVAYHLASRTGAAARSAIAWNIFGLVDFTIAVGIGLAIAPGPLQLIVPSIPNAGAGLYPTVLIPAFAVPSSILLHVLSLRQLRRARR